MKRNPYLFILLIILVAILVFNRGKFIYLFFAPRQNIGQNGLDTKTNPIDTKDIEIVAQNLNIPWEIAFLPTGDMLVTERSGKLLKIGSVTKVMTSSPLLRAGFPTLTKDDISGSIHPRAYARGFLESVIKEIEGVKHIGEGGLLGLALHPDFAKNNFVHLYSTTQISGKISNRVERYKLVNDVLSDRKVILEGIAGSVYHDGGRIAFGPDGYLYITTGDAESPNLAQDKYSLNGKILRIKDNGSIPPDNPFGNAVYSIGHRNPQGLAWDKNGILWETEHGPSGSQTGYDEVNIISKGGNFGWPTVKGDQVKEGLISPIIQSGSKDTWAPSGMAYWDGSLFFSGLRGESLYEAKIKSGNKLELVSHFKKEYGRLRAVVLGPDGFLYVTTSNRDGRGQVREGDDKIIKINPKIFR